MRGWLASRLGWLPRLKTRRVTPFLHEVRLICANGDGLQLTRNEGQAVLQAPGPGRRDLPLARRPLGDELAEELRRLDADKIYADALARVAGVPNLNDRPPMRVHIWQDPAVAEKPETAGKSDETAAKAGRRRRQPPRGRLPPQDRRGVTRRRDPDADRKAVRRLRQVGTGRRVSDRPSSHADADVLASRPRPGSRVP